MSATVISNDVACELGEGPTYDPLSRKLFWFDIVGRKLVEKQWPDGRTTAHRLPFMASAIAIVDEARHVIVADEGLYVRTAATGALSLLRSVEAGNPETRSNDSRVHQSGALWFSTMSRDEEKPVGSIYWYRRGEVKVLYAGLSIPNSICFSPDGAVAYFTDTPTRVLKKVRVDPTNGLPIGQPETFVTDRGVGWIDGSVVDADGVLWNAKWGSGRVDGYGPDGRLRKSLTVPTAQVSCPAFAGPEARALVVTTAWKGMDETQRDADPDAGKTFLLDMPVRGRFEPRVAL